MEIQKRSLVNLGTFCGILLSSQVLAREYSDLFATAKGRSMGGAMTAIVDDSNSLSYNPAGLAQIQDTTLRMPDLVQAYGSTNSLTLIKKVLAFEPGESVAAISSGLKQFDGDGMGFGLDVFGMGWFKKRMGIMVNPLSVNGSMRFRTPSILFASVAVRMTADSGISMGYAHPLLNNHLRLGVALRPFIIRGGVDRKFEGTEISTISADVLGYGWGYDADAGIQGNLDPIEVFGFDVKLMMGFVLQNIFAADFSNKISTRIASQPPALERRANWGVGAKIENLGIVTPTVSVEARDLGIPTNDWMEHLHAAFEIALKPRPWFQSFLRGHFAKGNVGGGVGGRLAYGELEFGTYAVNLGPGTGIGRDRRIYLALSAVW